jgi:hypothetical protein
VSAVAARPTTRSQATHSASSPLASAASIIDALIPEAGGDFPPHPGASGFDPPVMEGGNAGGLPFGAGVGQGWSEWWPSVMLPVS